LEKASSHFSFLLKSFHFPSNVLLKFIPNSESIFQAVPSEVGISMPLPGNECRSRFFFSPHCAL
jgi:hypothetical protein